MFAMTPDVAVFCGRTAIHIIPMTNPPKLTAVSLDLLKHIPEKCTADPQDLFSVGVDISESGRWLATMDSVKNAYLFEYKATEQAWRLHGSWVTVRRVTKIKIDREEGFVVMIDKTGDIYVSLIGPNKVSPPTKIMGHTSLVMDMALTKNNLCLITCDRDEKIRISSFPKAFQILGYALGHEAAVVNVCLLNEDMSLMSASADGNIKMWRFGTNGPNDHTPLGSWNILNILGLGINAVSPINNQVYELVRMRAMDFENRNFVAVLISGYGMLSIFEVDPMALTLRLVYEETLDHDVVDFIFVQNALFAHCPERGTVKKYFVPSGGAFIRDPTFLMVFEENTMRDIAAFGASYRPNMAPLMKRHLMPEPVYPPSPPPHSPPRAPSPLFPFAAPTVEPQFAHEGGGGRAALEAGLRSVINELDPFGMQEGARGFGVGQFGPNEGFVRNLLFTQSRTGSSLVSANPSHSSSRRSASASSATLPAENPYGVKAFVEANRSALSASSLLGGGGAVGGVGVGVGIDPGSSPYSPISSCSLISLSSPVEGGSTSTKKGKEKVQEDDATDADGAFAGAQSPFDPEEREQVLASPFMAEGRIPRVKCGSGVVGYHPHPFDLNEEPEEDKEKGEKEEEKERPPDSISPYSSQSRSSIDSGNCEGVGGSPISISPVGLSKASPTPRTSPEFGSSVPPEKRKELWDEGPVFGHSSRSSMASTSSPAPTRTLRSGNKAKVGEMMPPPLQLPRWNPKPGQSYSSVAASRLSAGRRVFIDPPLVVRRNSSDVPSFADVAGTTASVGGGSGAVVLLATDLAPPNSSVSVGVGSPEGVTTRSGSRGRGRGRSRGRGGRGRGRGGSSGGGSGGGRGGSRGRGRSSGGGEVGPVEGRRTSSRRSVSMSEDGWLEVGRRGSGGGGGHGGYGGRD